MKDKIIRKSGRAQTHTKYVTSYGNVVPGGSTIARMVNFQGCDGLISWGIRLHDSGTDPKQYREEAADFGKCFHRAVECQFLGQEFDSENFPGTYIEPSLAMRDNFYRLLDELGLVVVGSEVKGVSDVEEWGGTMDLLLAKASDPLKTPIILGDLKSSNSISPEHVIQVGGAYAVLFWEKFGRWPERTLLFRADRNPPHNVTVHTIRDELREKAIEAARLGKKLWKLKPALTAKI